MVLLINTDIWNDYGITRITVKHWANMKLPIADTCTLDAAESAVIENVDRTVQTLEFEDS